MTLDVAVIPLISDWNGEATQGFDVACEHDEMADVPVRSVFLIEGETVRATWLLGSELPDIDGIIFAAARLAG